MILLVLVLVGAVACGWLAGGRVRHMADLEINAPWLVFFAFGLQASLGVVNLIGRSAVGVAPAIMLVSLTALAVFLAWNRHLPGLWLIVAGFGMNAIVIAANGGMPVDPEAMRAVGGDDVRIQPGTHRLLTGDDRFRLLADIIPLPVVRIVVSAGDIVLAAGVGMLVVAQMRRFPPPPGRRVRPKPVPVWRRTR